MGIFISLVLGTILTVWSSIKVIHEVEHLQSSATAIYVRRANKLKIGIVVAISIFGLWSIQKEVKYGESFVPSPSPNELGRLVDGNRIFPLHCLLAHPALFLSVEAATICFEDPEP